MDNIRPEKMDDFFKARINNYDEHMITEVPGCRKAYKKLAELILKNNFLIKTMALLAMSTLFLILPGCNPRVTEDKAITIASAYVPPDVLTQSQVECTTYPLYAEQPMAWIVIFDLSNISLTSGEIGELVKLGYNTSTLSPDNAYSAIIISVDAKNRKINYKDTANGPYWGGGPSDKLPPNHVVDIWVGVISIIVCGILALLWLLRRSHQRT